MVTANMSFSMAVNIDIVEHPVMMKIKNVFPTCMSLFPLHITRRKRVMDIANIPTGKESRKTHCNTSEKNNEN